MGIVLLLILEAAMVASSLSIDAFVAGFAYGSKRIRIPALSVQIINVICSGIIGLSLMLGAAIRPFINDRVAVWIAFAILFAIGLFKVLDSLVKTVIRRNNGINRAVRLSLFNIRFILNIYADPEKVDVDDSKSISPAEAAALALSLSLDGITVGFGAALTSVNAPAVFILSLVTNPLAIILGCLSGNRLVKNISFNVTWIGGVILMGLAVVKLF